MTSYMYIEKEHESIAKILELLDSSCIFVLHETVLDDIMTVWRQRRHVGTHILQEVLMSTPSTACSLWADQSLRLPLLCAVIHAIERE